MHKIFYFLLFFLALGGNVKAQYPIEIKHKDTGKVLVVIDDPHYYDFRDMHLKGADFTGVNLMGADFTGAYLKNAVFFNCDLSGASFEDAYLKDANFHYADLFGTHWQNSYCKGAEFDGTIFEGFVK